MCNVKVTPASSIGGKAPVYQYHDMKVSSLCAPHLNAQDEPVSLGAIWKADIDGALRNSVVDHDPINGREPSYCGCTAFVSISKKVLDAATKLQEVVNNFDNSIKDESADRSYFLSKEVSEFPIYCTVGNLLEKH